VAVARMLLLGLTLVFMPAMAAWVVLLAVA
jgi:hypothetical protein